ncbi:HIT domain-containing protein [Candidatus Microgenomates bacterium]|nr:HIT domain-containing protein [Candidatus Microgenomates bacterium]
MEECVFCKIIKKEIPAEFLYEGERVIAFPDVKPAAYVHILIVPKEHIPTFTDIQDNHKEVISEMISVAQQLIKEKGVEKKYRMTFNGGVFQHVPHLHWHLLGGEWVRDVG